MLLQNGTIAAKFVSNIVIFCIFEKKAVPLHRQTKMFNLKNAKLWQLGNH